MPPGYRRRPAFQRSRPRPTRAMVNPPHSRVQRKVAMAGLQWADLKGACGGRAQSKDERAETNGPTALGLDDWAPFARRDQSSDGFSSARP